MRAAAFFLVPLLIALGSPMAARGAPADAGSPDAALARILAAARSEVPRDCARPGADRLVHILCAGRIRIGVRFDYPLFSQFGRDDRKGYEIDIARAIARRLGVEPEFTTVHAATRVPMVADGRVDLTIATMGDNTERHDQVRFIRPHYYQSQTIVVGPKDLAVRDWQDLSERTVCATVGNGSNAELVGHRARLMLFDDASLLPERLEDETCTLAAQDDSFFASYFTDPAFAQRFSAKFGFARVPWGMAVARHGGEQLARALDLLSQIFHRDGVFLNFARAHHIGTAFLAHEQALWRTAQCDTAAGSENPACILPPLDIRTKPTRFAGKVVALERRLARLGIHLSLPMLTAAPAWSLFLNGVVNSLILVLGTLAATFALALCFGMGLGARSPLLRWPARALTVALQSSPILLTLVLVAAVIHAIVAYSSAVALGAAILALGLANGANAGQAISEAIVSLRAEQPALSGARAALFFRAVGRSATQLMGFLVNAAKGTPIASFIGAPELLNALTDITSFSSGRATVYSLLLVFYTAVVILVVCGCTRFRLFLERREARA